MVVEQQQDSRTIHLGALSWIVKARWDHKLGMDLDVHVERPMPGPDGRQFRADIALVDPQTHNLVAVFEVKNTIANGAEVRHQLQRLLASVRMIASVENTEEDPPEDGLLVPKRFEPEAETIKDELATDQVVVEAW